MNYELINEMQGVGITVVEKEEIDEHFAVIDNQIVWHYIENDCFDIWEWSEKIYEYAKNIDS